MINQTESFSLFNELYICYEWQVHISNRRMFTYSCIIFWLRMEMNVQ